MSHDTAGGGVSPKVTVVTSDKELRHGETPSFT